MRYRAGTKFQSLRKDGTEGDAFYEILNTNDQQYSMMLYNKKGERQAFVDKTEIFVHWELNEISHFPWEQKVQRSSKLCVCHSKDLFDYGCRCGSIEKYKEPKYE